MMYFRSIRSVRVVDLKGQTVHEIREMYEQVFGLDPQAIALINGRRASDDMVLKGNEKLEFALPEKSSK